MQLAQRRHRRAPRRWAADRGLAADDELSYVREFEHITLARVLLARHAAERDAARSTTRSRCWTGCSPRPRKAGGRAAPSRSSSLLALAHARRRRRAAAAIAALEEALRPRRARGLRPASSSTPARRWRRCCARSRRRAPPRDHARRVLAADRTRAATRSRRRRTGLVDELSARELDVLRLLRSDLSGPDIARELIVSLNTVRTHTKNIYTKLGVNNRREAVRRAAELGL